MIRNEGNIARIQNVNSNAKGVLVVAPKSNDQDGYTRPQEEAINHNVDTIIDWMSRTLEIATLSELTRRIKLDRTKENLSGLRSRHWVGERVIVRRVENNPSAYEPWADVYLSYHPQPFMKHAFLEKGAIVKVVAVAKHLADDKILLGVEKEGWLSVIPEENVTSCSVLSSKYSIGDKVQIDNPGKTYTSYREWAQAFLGDLLYKYNVNETPMKREVGTVVTTGKHGSFNKTLVAVEIDEKIYIINEDAVSPYLP